MAASLAGLREDDALPPAIPFDDGVANLTYFAFNLNLSDFSSEILELESLTVCHFILSSKERVSNFGALNLSEVEIRGLLIRR